VHGYDNTDHRWNDHLSDTDHHWYQQNASRGAGVYDQVSFEPQQDVGSEMDNILGQASNSRRPSAPPPPPSSRSERTRS
jgi:hypothetical protein